jgi:hypothetical protein
VKTLQPDPRNPDSYDLISLPGNTLLVTHPSSKCVGHACPVHHPSDHHMVNWPLHWRWDRRIMERICQHGIGHPDPDSIAHGLLIGSTDTGNCSCDGCCRTGETA